MKKAFSSFSIFLIAATSWSQNTLKRISQEPEVEYEYEYERLDTVRTTVFEEQEFEYDYVDLPDVVPSANEEDVEYDYLASKSVEKIASSDDTYASTSTLSGKNSSVKARKVLHKVNKSNHVTHITSTEKAYSLEKMDSLYEQELYSTDLYDNVRKDVAQYDSEKVEIAGLTTNMLMQRLEHLNERTPFNVEYNPVLENVIKKYLKTRRTSLERIISKSHYYFPLFEKELDKYQIPMEIKYLAVVESGLIPRAKSPVGATGLWQFMYETGKMHNLKVNSYVDDRMDPLKATKAACEYLSSLHKIFNDWDLALAAYNSGPGNVLKAIRRAGGKRNYWNIRHYLPRETAGYLPAFLATMYLFEYAHEHELKKAVPQYAFFSTDTVRLKKKVTFNEISKAIDIEVKELRFLNPSYKLSIIPKSTRNPHSLRLPIDKINDFVNYEEKLYGLASTRENSAEKSMYHNYSKTRKFTYVVRSGDYLGKIASKFNTTISLIKSWNNLRSSKIRVGQKLTIYNKKTNADGKTMAYH